MAQATDPRTEPDFIAAGHEASVTPIVRRPSAGPSGLVVGVFAVAGAVLLFTVLETRRETSEAPTVRRSSADAYGLPSTPPPLVIPPAPAPIVQAIPAAVPVQMQPPSLVQRVVTPPPQVSYAPPNPVYVPPVPQPPTPRNASGPILVLDNGVAATAGPPGGGASAVGSAASQISAINERARAGTFSNPATTVPQGTLIPAVLETAFNSTQAGYARAIVSRDVRGFDGTRVLIPRGSRLIGEYGGDVAQGQKRALIAWQRLIRPDGMTIAIGSPATDTLGRGGIPAQVNSHFFERFSGALLQSTLNAGVSLASSAASRSVVVLPGALSGSAAQIQQPAQITPTLKVAAGKSISVFAARDLDFTSADAGH